MAACSDEGEGVGDLPGADLFSGKDDTTHRVSRSGAKGVGIHALNQLRSVHLEDPLLRYGRGFIEDHVFPHQQRLEDLGEIFKSGAPGKITSPAEAGMVE